MNSLLVKRVDQSITRLQEQRAISDGVPFMSHHRQDQPMHEGDLAKMENFTAQAILDPGSMTLKLLLYLRPLARDDEYEYVPAQTLRPECRSDSISSCHEQRYRSQSWFSRRVGIFENIQNKGFQVVVGTVCAKFLNHGWFGESHTNGLCHFSSSADFPIQPTESIQ
jgi:hypothetical protein